MEGGSSSASGGGVGKIEKWVNLHRSMYERATRHPFTVSISDGSVDLAAFKRWLISFNRQRLVPEPVAHMRAQDYIFVRKFVSFLASVLLKACKHSDDESDMEVLLGGMAYLSDELPWFRKEASKWGVSLLGVIPQKANLEYISFLESLMIPEVDFAIVATVFWAIEAVYQESFSLCLTSSSKTPDELTETCHRWGSETFGHYCRSLQKIADRCLAKAPSDVVQKAEEAFLSVLEHEINFWNMSYGE